MPATRKLPSRPDEATYRKVNLLCNLAADRLDDFLAALGIRLWKSGKALVGPCPVHGGTRRNAFNLYPDGHTARGIWLCQTRGCHTTFKRDLVGLAHGVLSRQQGRKVEWHVARDWVCDFVGQPWDGLAPDLARADKARFVAGMGVFAPPAKAVGASPREVAQRLRIPSPYFLDRGFRAETLEAFMVGEPREPNPSSVLYRRAIAPVLCPAGKVVLGYSGRSLNEQCPSCSVWHEPGECPPEEHRGHGRFAKWYHHQFPKREVLYGLHLATDAIKDRDEVILVEGPGKVWRMHEAGYPNSVACFGVSLADPQQALLESLPAGRVTLLLDPNAAGAAGAETIKKQLGRSFRARALVPPDDPADMEAGALKDFMGENCW